MSAADGRRVLITGAASGLGAALADAFEARGDRVLRTDVRGERGLETGLRPSSTAVLGLDITSDDDWAAALSHV